MHVLGVLTLKSAHIVPDITIFYKYMPLHKTSIECLTAVSSRNFELCKQSNKYGLIIVKVLFNEYYSRKDNLASVLCEALIYIIFCITITL